MKNPIQALSAAMVLAVSLSLVTWSPVPSASASAAWVTIEAPESPSAGTVSLTGSVGRQSGEISTVLYVFDATDSTASPTESDCSGNGAVGPDDDVNGDGSVGDVLDCEIAGVLALNRGLATTSGLQVGLVAFANQAAAADLDPAGTATFVPPAYTGGDSQPRLDTASRSVVRNQIGLYDARALGGSGSGTAFNSAISVALSTLGAAPPGPKWIMFLSDGQSAIDDGLLGQLTQSGVRLRSFGIGADATCARTASLYKMAAATGESCELAPRPASLAAGLVGSQPDAVNGVNVSIEDVSVAAAVDAVGGWRAAFTLGAGTYTATATAVLASGATHSTQRTLTVAPGEDGLVPGTVSPGPGALRATMVRVRRPAPSRAVVPAQVTGRVGRPTSGLRVTPRLAGSRVLLQARTAVGDPWTTVDRDTVNRRGTFVLSWNAKPRLSLLRVVLRNYRGFAGSAAAVPEAKISDCKVNKGRNGFSLTCQTTAQSHSLVRLLQDGRATDRTRVRQGSFRLHGTGRAGAHTIDITTATRHIRLAL